MTEEEEEEDCAKSNSQFYKMHQTLTLIDKKLTRVGIITIYKTSLTTFMPQLMATTAAGYLIAWGPFAGLCIWEMGTEPQVDIFTIII